MLPLAPAISLAFVSFVSSVFVILRIIIPILPPHPLSRRVRPSEFGLPNFRSLSPADKSHLWLASCDIVALALFTWQVAAEYASNSPDHDATQEPASAARLWLALTLRQTCLLVVAILTLVHVRMGRSVQLGKRHWMLWAPTLLFVATSTSLAAVLAATDVPSFFMGLFAYTSTLALGSSIAFGCLIGTFVMIKRNLVALNEIRDPWPPVKEGEEKPRPSFATEDIEALKDGSSWVTSRASSRRESISAFSFSTHHSAVPSNGSVRMMMQNQAAAASQPSIPHKSSFWFGPTTPYNGHESPVPPVPPLPSPYRPSSFRLNDDPDPFRRHEPKDRLGSQSSWLTEPSTYQPTLTAWSFPTTRPDSPPPSASVPEMCLPSTTAARSTPVLGSAQVLGGYGYDTERTVSPTSTHASEVDVSVVRTAGWLVTIWVPLVLTFPYLFMTTSVSPFASSATAIPLILSVTLSSPLLALHILFRSPLPIPSLFDTFDDPPSAVMRAPSPQSIVPSFKFSHEYKRSGSVTIVEGRRSGDVWMSNGDAVDGKSKLSRAMGLLQPVPKLAVLPIDDIEQPQLTPPLPIQTEEDVDGYAAQVPVTPAQSEHSIELGQMRSRKESKASSYYSGGSDSAAFHSQILIAQKHYSTLALKMVLPPSPERRASMDSAAATAAATGVDAAKEEATRPMQHLRTRSTSSIVSQSRFPISPPPASPLPPTPPSIKELRERQARLIQHRKSQSQSSSLLNFSFRPVASDEINEIDALSAGVLPLLVPGLTVGSDVKVREWNWDSPISFASKDIKTSSRRSSRTSKVLPQELGGLSSEFSSPQMHSTPPSCRPIPRERKTSAHKKHHFSLPSLSLGKDGSHALSTWRNEFNRAAEGTLGQYTAVSTSDNTRRNTVYSGEMMPNTATTLNVVSEEEELLRPISPVADAPTNRPTSSVYSLGSGLPSPKDFHDEVNAKRNSLATLITALDQELRMPASVSDITLFDFDTTSGPQAESTPHDSRKPLSKPSSQRVPPIPSLPAGTKTSRRSSIVYIKSNENSPPASKPATIAPKAGSGWPSRVVRPLAPKAKGKGGKAKAATSSEDASSDSPKGLRPLSLLQDRDTNQTQNTLVKKLSIGRKKGKAVADENTGSAPKSRGLKPLKLTRKDTTIERAALRKEEVLPDVVVRPPSESQYTGFAYAFHS